MRHQHAEHDQVEVDPGVMFLRGCSSRWFRPLFGICIVIFGLLCILPIQRAAARTFVVAIGNNTGQAHEQPLLYAEKDAHALMSVLQRFGDAHPRDTVLLQGRSGKEILQTLGALHGRISRLSPEERARAKLIVYYSGHADGGGLHAGNSRIAYEMLRQSMRSIPVAVRVLVVDGCRSGGLTRVKGARPVAPFAITAQSKLNTAGFVMISSSTATEDSHESDELKGSFFTHHFLNALRGLADRDKDGEVSLQESYNYAYHHTLRSSSSTLSLQHPTLERRLRGRGALILSRPALASDRTGAIVLGSATSYLVYKSGEGGSVIAELLTEQPEQVLRLAPGSYKVQQRGLREYRTYRIRVEAGQTKRLSAHEAEVLAYEELVRKGGQKSTSNSLLLSMGVRGPLFHQSSWSPSIALGYTLHLAHFSLSARLRGTRGAFVHQEPHNETQTVESELGLGISIERYLDFRWGSVAFGLWTEGLYFQQRTRSSKLEPRRHSFGAVFGGSFALQVPVSKRMGIRFEAGPVTYLLRRSKIADSEKAGASLATPFTGVAHLGGYLRF